MACERLQLPCCAPPPHRLCRPVNQLSSSLQDLLVRGQTSPQIKSSAGLSSSPTIYNIDQLHFRGFCRTILIALIVSSILFFISLKIKSRSFSWRIQIQTQRYEWRSGFIYVILSQSVFNNNNNSMVWKGRAFCVPMSNLLFAMDLLGGGHHVIPTSAIKMPLVTTNNAQGIAIMIISLLRSIYI